MKNVFLAVAVLLLSLLCVGQQAPVCTTFTVTADQFLAFDGNGSNPITITPTPPDGSVIVPIFAEAFFKVGTQPYQFNPDYTSSLLIGFGPIINGQGSLFLSTGAFDSNGDLTLSTPSSYAGTINTAVMDYGNNTFGGWSGSQIDTTPVIGKPWGFYGVGGNPVTGGNGTAKIVFCYTVAQIQ